MNTLTSVFESSAKNHIDFKPVHNWLYIGKGKIVYGGSDYIKELSRTKYLAVFKQFNIAGKAKFIKADEIDAKTKFLSTHVKHKDFDDPHIVALLIISKCRLLCSLDKRANKFFKNKLFFSKNDMPKIYSNSKNSQLLCDKNIAAICLPCSKVTNAQKRLINKPK